MARVVVVGAGIAGLACAWRLRALGHDAEVFEREATPGGRMRSERLGPFVIDRGAQFVASAYRNLHAVVRELGLEDRLRPLARTQNAILRDGRLEPGEWDSATAFLRSRLLSVPARLRVAGVLFSLWRHAGRLHPLRPELAAPLDREDMATWLRRVAGDEALEYLFAPAFSSTFDSDPEDLSAAFALLTLRFVSGGFRLECFEGGTGLLTRSLAQRVPVRVGWEVVAVEPRPDGVRVRTRGPGREREQEADGVVVAVPGSEVAALCPALRPAEKAFFSEVRYGRGIIVHLAFDEAPRTLPWYGVAFPRREGLDLYGLAVDHWKPGAAPEGAGLLNAALSAAAAHRLWDEPDARIVEVVLENLARTPVGRLEPCDSAVHRWDPMLPQLRAGHLPRLAAFLSRSERSPRLAFAGDYLVGPYTEAALTSGLRAAAEMAALLAKAPEAEFSS
jgi:oxygen-dependent protoporphyrinogen oxidase